MTDATTEEIIQQHTQAIEDVTLSVASLTQALQSEAKRATESDDLQSGRTKSAEEKADAAEAAANDAKDSVSTHVDDKANPHNVTAEQTGARPLADLAVYEEKDGKVEKTDDALVKKSEVTDEYSDLWVLETGEEVELYFTWVEDSEYFWLSNFEGWDGSKGGAPPSFPAYYTTVLEDAKATSEVLLTCFKNGSEASTSIKATRRVKKNALGLALVGDNVSEFANDAGYAKTAEVDSISQRVDALSAKVDSANAALEEVV